MREECVDGCVGVAVVVAKDSFDRGCPGFYWADAAGWAFMLGDCCFFFAILLVLKGD